MNVMMIGGMSCPCCGDGMVTVFTEEGSSAKISVLVMRGKSLGFGLLLGINAIKTLGGMVVGPIGSVQLGNKEIVKCAAISINEPDFTATFNHRSQAWTVAWKWSEGCTPEALDNRVAEYLVAEEIREDYKQELHSWMSNGSPIQRGRTGTPKGLIPLMAVLQQHKSKVRPVMDFRQLNCYVDVFTANTNVCAAKLHQWWQKCSNVSLLDLKRAYLQVRVQKTLRLFQTVKIGRQKYCLTHLGFGLNVAPLIMKAIVSVVLLQVEAVGHMASAYIDDIYVNEDVMPATRVREHLARFGLECKDPEQLEDDTQMLGLAVAMEHGKSGGSMVPNTLNVVMRRAVFSLCGRLVGHFPVCGWLRVTCRVLKRRASSVTKGWGDETRDNLHMMRQGTTCI